MRNLYETIALVCKLTEGSVVCHEIVYGKRLKMSGLSQLRTVNILQRMKQAFIFDVLLAASELMIRFRTCMIVIAVAWSVGAMSETWFFGGGGARRIFVALRHGKYRNHAQTSHPPAPTITTQPAVDPYFGTCKVRARKRGRLHAKVN